MPAPMDLAVFVVESEKEYRSLDILKRDAKHHKKLHDILRCQPLHLQVDDDGDFGR